MENQPLPPVVIAPGLKPQRTWVGKNPGEVVAPPKRKKG
jgi:hypothetical protein